MAICRYWQQGQCRFGNDCRFEHGTGGGGGYSYNDGGGGGGFGQQQQQQQQQRGYQDITNTLVQTVKVDIEQWEKGNQWVFSCYSPAKDTPCFPGIDDISPEEMRLEAYAAKSANNVEEYQKKVQSMITDYANKRRCLFNPNDQIKDVLRRIYNKENVPNSLNLFGPPVGGGGGIFGGGGSSSSQQPFLNQNSGSSIFGGSSSSSSNQVPSGSIFARPSQSTSPFGTSSSVFGGSSTSVFGSQQQQQQQQQQSVSSVFGQSPTKPQIVSQSSGSIFGQPPPIFGSPGATPGGSLFGQQQQPSTSVFGQGQQQQQQINTQQTFGAPSTFGSPPSFSSPSLFGVPGSAAAPQQPSLFGQAAANPSSVFGQPLASSSSSLFGGNQPASSVFGGGGGAAAASPFAASQPPTEASLANPFQSASAVSNPFGGVNSSASSTVGFGQPVSGGAVGGGGVVGLFGQIVKPQMDSSIYTPIEALTDDEKMQFMAERFILGKIPERPPCREMCGL